MVKYTYLPDKKQWRDNETGRFASGVEVVKSGEIQITENNRFKQKGGPFVAQEAIIKREKEDKPFEAVEIGERLIIADDDGNIDQIRTYSPNEEINNKAIVRQGIEQNVISESEYNEAETMLVAADLVRERAIISQQVI